MSLYDNLDDSIYDKFKDLLAEYGKEKGVELEIQDNLDLSESQKKAFETFKKGDSLLILGSAGTGKSRLVKELYKYIKQHQPEKTMYITSTTGISAYNIGGVTINSFMGIGTAESSIEVLLKRMRYKMAIKDRLRKTDILVIDEISMMSASTFEKIDVLFKTLKKSRSPFGGIQLVLTGDFLQLETVFFNKKNDNVRDNDNNSDTRLIVESDLFEKMFKKSTIVLKENFRQQSDNKYIDILMRIRKGNHTRDDINVLLTRMVKQTDDTMIHLVSSNRKAQEINNKQLNKIKQYNEKHFEVIYTKFGEPDTCDLLQKELHMQFVQKGMEILSLRIGCRVLLIKNLDVSTGLVNGSTGTVVDILQDAVKVKFDNGVTEVINRTEWELEMDTSRVVCQQIPLMLAYSITIHKSQSLSLENAVLDLSDCFCNHMVYVALSRVKSLSGLYLKSIDPSKITVNQKLLEFIEIVEKQNSKQTVNKVNKQ